MDRVPEVVRVVFGGAAVVSRSEVEEAELRLSAQPRDDLQRVFQALQRRRESERQYYYTCMYSTALREGG